MTTAAAVPTAQAGIPPKRGAVIPATWRKTGVRLCYPGFAPRLYGVLALAKSLKQFVAIRVLVLRHGAQNTAQRADAKNRMIRDGNALVPRLFRFKDDMAALLMNHPVSPPRHRP